MVSYMGWGVAGVCMILSLFLWFREVRKVMTERRSTVESAAGQYYACCQRMAENGTDTEIAAVCERSLHIYHQALELYEKALAKPFYRLPAKLLGFRSLR